MQCRTAASHLTPDGQGAEDLTQLGGHAEPRRGSAWSDLLPLSVLKCSIAVDCLEVLGLQIRSIGIAVQ
jgi:hypothetical protein